MENRFLCQNDAVALNYLKANYYCEIKSKRVTYFSIIISVVICLAGILNTYFDLIAPLFGNAAALQSVKNDIALTVNFIAGMIFIFTMILSVQSKRLSVESVTILEKYDAYVFGLPLNPMIMRPVSDAVIHTYANKVRKKSTSFFYHYYLSHREAEAETACFDRQQKNIHDDYRLMLFVKPFFMTLWIGFAVIVFLFALSFNDMFLSTLTNILFPSLSVLSLIAESWHNFSCRLRMLQNSTVILQNYITSDKKKNIHLLRNIQDGIFNLRLMDFTIPALLVKKFEKSVAAKDKTQKNRSRKKNIKKK